MRLETSVGLDVTVFEAVIACEQADARITLARQLAALVSDSETPQLEKDQVVPVLMKLATDTDRDVRAVLAEELADIKDLHQDLIFAIAADENPIALPFLAVTPALNAWHMQAIMRVGDDARQKTVARRPDIAADAVTFIVRAGNPAAVVALLDNPKVKLKVADLQSIYNRLPQAGEVVDRLLLRNDLPLDIRITQAKRAAVRMRQMMAERGWMPANDASDLVADAEEGAVLQVLTQADVAERMQAMNFLSSQNMLTPSLIIRAACLGDMAVLSAALAHLSGQPQPRVLGLLLTRGAAGVRSMINRSMLPTGCHAIISAACDVAAQAREEDIRLDADGFGRRMLEMLMLQFGALVPRDQAKLMDYVGRFADDKVRKIARKLKSDMLRAA